MQDTAIIGAGIAGLACATALVAAGQRVTLFDKGRGPGGRMSSRRLPTAQGEASFDHGAQYFTAATPTFAAEVARWVAAGWAAPWPPAGDHAFVGTPAMNAPVKGLAAALDVHWATEITAIHRGSSHWRLTGAPGTFARLIIAVPAEQAARLLAAPAPALAAHAAAVRSTPCWTLMAAFEAPLAAPDILSPAPPIGWAARNNAKPGRTGPESWVIQADAAWSLAHLEDPAETVTTALLQALATSLAAPLPPLLATSAHRWRYALPHSTQTTPIWDAHLNLGLTGDWCTTAGAQARIGGAFASGQMLAQRIIS